MTRNLASFWFSAGTTERQTLALTLSRVSGKLYTLTLPNITATCQNIETG